MTGQPLTNLSIITPTESARPHVELRQGLSNSPLQYVDDVITSAQYTVRNASAQTIQSTADRADQTDPSRIISQTSTSTQTVPQLLTTPTSTCTSTQTSSKLKRERNKCIQTETTSQYPGLTSVSTQTDTQYTPVLLHSKDKLSPTEILEALADISIQHGGLPIGK